MTRLILRLALFVLVPLLAAGITWQTFRSIFLEPADPESSTPILVEITSDKSSAQVCDELAERKVIKTALSLCFLFKSSNAPIKINAGEYALSASMTPHQIIQKLNSGEVYYREVKVPPSISVWQIGEIIERAGLLSAAEFNKLLTDSTLLALTGVRAQSFEGYLYPAVYQLTKPIAAKEIIWKMMLEGEKHWPSEYTDRADELKLTRHEVLTIASIIAKEAEIPEDYANLSSVIHNRLSHGMKLESDATVIYGLRDFQGTLNQALRATPHEYNTYIKYGLPPGPLGNPEESAIRAALYPADTTYLYFFKAPGGALVFSATLNEHQEALKKYIAPSA